MKKACEIYSPSDFSNIVISKKYYCNKGKIIHIETSCSFRQSNKLIHLSSCYFSLKKFHKSTSCTWIVFFGKYTIVE